MELQVGSQPDLKKQFETEPVTSINPLVNSKNNRKIIFFAIVTGLLIIIGIIATLILSERREPVSSTQKNPPSQLPTGYDKPPVAWANDAYSGKIGNPVEFTARGSYDPSGYPISLYEWDFDGDGTFEYKTKNETVTHIYEEAYKGPIYLRVTSKNGTAISKAIVDVNQLGYASQGDETPCQLDENGYSIILDENGNFLNCTATNLPTKDKEGVMIIKE